MIISKGSISFRTFTVIGPNVSPSPDTIMEGLEQYQFDGFAGEEGRARGWISLDHLLDCDFDRAKNVRGSFVCWALRIDQRKVSPAIFKAHCLMEMKAHREALGVAKVPVSERREIRRRIREQLLKETTPSSNAYGVFWNVRSRLLHLMTTSKSVITEFNDLFQRSFELSLEARNPAVLGMDMAREADLADAFNDLMPTSFFAEVANAS